MHVKAESMKAYLTYMNSCLKNRLLTGLNQLLKGRGGASEFYHTKRGGAEKAIAMLKGDVQQVLG